MKRSITSPEFLIGFISAIGVLMALSSYAIENPFAIDIEGIETTTGSGEEYKGGKIEKAHPLQQSPITNYILMGVITSKDKSVAMIKSSEGKEYFIHVGDFLGNAGGKVFSINRKGIEVKEKSQIKALIVRNKGVSDE